MKQSSETPLSGVAAMAKEFSAEADRVLKATTPKIIAAFQSFADALKRPSA